MFFQSFEQHRHIVQQQEEAYERSLFDIEEAARKNSLLPFHFATYLPLTKSERSIWYHFKELNVIIFLKIRMK